MGSLNAPHTLRSDIDKGLMSYFDQPSGSAAVPTMEQSATRDEVKMSILHGARGIDDYYAHATEPPAPKQSLGIVQQICNYWYHGRCFSREGCKFVHCLDPSLQLAKGQAVKHKKPCGLERCRYKNGTPPHKIDSARADSVTGVNAIGLPGRSQHSPTKETLQGQKRKYFDFHADDARRWGTTKAGEIDYDGRDDYAHAIPSQTHNQASLATPTEPQPTISNSYVESLLRTLQYNTGSAVRSPVSSTRRDSVIDVPDDVVQSNIDRPRKKSKRVKATAANETCFFWYHDSCGRARTSACPYLHQLTDPPTMVQPPPGYVHRTPCVREWCPGDAGGAQTSRRNDRGREGLGANASRAEHNGGNGNDNDKHEDDNQDWFLTGFDEPE